MILPKTDRGAKETVMLRNKLDSLLRNTQKSFAKFGGPLSQNDQDLAREGILPQAEATLRGNSIDEIKKALDSFGPHSPRNLLLR
jgi:hypothetical protein